MFSCDKIVYASICSLKQWNRRWKKKRTVEKSFTNGSGGKRSVAAKENVQIVKKAISHDPTFASELPFTELGVVVEEIQTNYWYTRSNSA